MKNFINRRFDFLTHNKKQMIQSILNKPKHSILFNKLIINQPYTQVITNPSTISHLVCQHYQQWTRLRNTQPLSNFSNWKSEYEPISRINPDWFISTLSPFTPEEIIQVIKSRHNNLAPGPSQIPYIVYKKLGPLALQHITILFNEILKFETTPLKWNEGSIYPIPKQKAWENNLNNTHPITLLDTCRKIFTKCITNKLSKILSTHPILSSLNWAALPGCSTQEPIHILQNIIEDTKENSQQV